MVLKLALLFILLPLVELALLVEVGRRIGTVPTIALVVLTGAAGAYLARREGAGALRRAQADLREGRVPAPHLVDAVVILLAAVMLVTPGILTDAVGFLCLVPGTRRLIRAQLWRLVTRAVRRGTADVRVTFDPRNHPPDIDVPNDARPR